MKIWLFLMVVALMAASGCGKKAEEGAEPTLPKPTGEAVAGELTPKPTGGDVSGPMPTTEPHDGAEVLDFFELADAAIAPELREGNGYHDGRFVFFESVVLDGMEYAVLDCSFLAESAFDDAYAAAAEQFLPYCPEATRRTKLFLRRTEGGEPWEAAVLGHVSEDGGDLYSDPYIAFNSRENGMIVFGEEYMYIYVTTDAGATWSPSGSIPGSGETVVGAARCIAGCGEGRFLIGCRYKGGSVTGNLSLTEDNGQSWRAVELPLPGVEDMEYRYSEPLRFRQEDGKLFLEMYAVAGVAQQEGSEPGNNRVSYEVVSSDGGLSWELK